MGVVEVDPEEKGVVRVRASYFSLRWLLQRRCGSLRRVSREYPSSFQKNVKGALSQNINLVCDLCIHCSPFSLVGFYVYVWSFEGPG